jgi:hypothetical protein
MYWGPAGAAGAGPPRVGSLLLPRGSVDEGGGVGAWFTSNLLWARARVVAECATGWPVGEQSACRRVVPGGRALIRSARMAETPRGCFIVLEGIDGSGTTLQRARSPIDCASAAARCWRPASRPRRDRGPHPRASQRRAAALDPAGPRPPLRRRSPRPPHPRGPPAVAAGQVVISIAICCPRSPTVPRLRSAWIREINARAGPPGPHPRARGPRRGRLRSRPAAHGQGAAVEERFDALALQRRVAEHYRRFRDDPGLGPVRVIDGTASPAQVTAALSPP